MKLSWQTIYFITLIWSAIIPVEYFAWFLEVLAAIIGLVVLAVSYKEIPFTRFAYNFLVH